MSEQSPVVYRNSTYTINSLKVPGGILYTTMVRSIHPQVSTVFVPTPAEPEQADIDHVNITPDREYLS